jgi:hypothetical protein
MVRDRALTSDAAPKSEVIRRRRVTTEYSTSMEGKHDVGPRLRHVMALSTSHEMSLYPPLRDFIFRDLIAMRQTTFALAQSKHPTDATSGHLLRTNWTQRPDSIYKSRLSSRRHHGATEDKSDSVASDADKLFFSSTSTPKSSPMGAGR